MKRLMITKNSVVKFQNLVVNHESRPVKLNPAHELKGLLTELWNAALDHGASKTVCGQVWLDNYLDSLPENERSII